MNSANDIVIRQTKIDDLDLIAPMFDAYRQFYGQPADLALAQVFLLERFQNDESVIFLALDQSGASLGFTQLYPSFSSVSARQIFVLNDLFVAPEARRRNVARLLFWMPLPSSPTPRAQSD